MLNATSLYRSGIIQPLHTAFPVTTVKCFAAGRQHMASPPLNPVYDDLLDFIIEQTSPRKILAFKVSDEAQARADELVDRLKAGELTLEEVEELEQMRRYDELVSMLKAKALAALKGA